MEIIGIVCEYNPFHNGHLYHIKKIKELYPDSLIILVLNGYFLERGEISILSKEAKTKIALANNIDIILELPVIYGTQSADTFASVAIKILNNFFVTKIVFGSESNDINLIKDVAKSQFKDDFDIKIKEYLDKGINYPTALAKAINIDFNFTPNDLLGISYVKAIIKKNYNIEPICIKRTSDYHDKISNDNIVSATNIREKIKNNEDISKYIPINIKDFINNINYNNYFNLLKYKINTDLNLSNYLDVDEGVEYRLKEFINKSNNIEDFIKNIKTKRYTYNKINRMFIHILLNFLKSDNIELEYIKILGFNNKGKEYLNNIKNKLNISTIVNKDSIQYKYELNASIVYDIINNTNTYQYELKNKPIIID